MAKYGKVQSYEKLKQELEEAKARLRNYEKEIQMYRGKALKDVFGDELPDDVDVFDTWLAKLKDMYDALKANAFSAENGVAAFDEPESDEDLEEMQEDPSGTERNDIDGE